MRHKNEQGKNQGTVIIMQEEKQAKTAFKRVHISELTKTSKQLKIYSKNIKM